MHHVLRVLKSEDIELTALCHVGWEISPSEEPENEFESFNYFEAPNLDDPRERGFLHIFMVILYLINCIINSHF